MNVLIMFGESCSVYALLSENIHTQLYIEQFQVQV